jgi:glyoxylase-like metal-dependent hydrolase (beta-lactamase superfamily II)
MWFRQLVDSHNLSLSYLLGCNASGEVLALDPQPKDWTLIQALVGEFGGHIQAILLTHVHQPALVLQLQSHGLPVIHGQPDAATDTHPPDTVTWGQEILHVLRTPGHTPGCLSYLWHDRLFCGDVLDATACADQRQPADAGQLWESLQKKVLTLPGETLLFPAHVIHGRMVMNLNDYNWPGPIDSETHPSGVLMRATAMAPVVRQSRDAFVAALSH